ncbi:hypothetical protein AB6C55_11710 [Vibrio splendidus]
MTTTVKIELKGHQVELMPAFIGYRLTFKAANQALPLSLKQKAIEQAESSMTQLEILERLLLLTSVHSHFHIVISDNGVSIQALNKKVLALYDHKLGELLTFNDFDLQAAQGLVNRVLNENRKHH